jgi:Big-like domain-containing protein
MSSPKKKLRLIGAFAVLGSLALAVSCHGFFVNPTWASITIQPPSPAVAVGFTQTLSAWGTDTDGNRAQIRSNLVWGLSGASNGGIVANLDPSSGVLTGVAAGTVTVTASSEGVSGTATATVAEEVATMTITPADPSVIDDGTSYAPYTIVSGSNNITSLVTLTAYQGTTAITEITCGYEIGLAGDGTQDCIPASNLVPAGSPAQQYTIVVTYAGYTGTTQVSALMTVTAPQ